MKRICLIPVLIIGLTSCIDNTETAVVKQNLITVDTLNAGCVGSYEILESGENINKEYGKEKIKHGHWINFGFVNQKLKHGKTVEHTAAKVVRIKLEEGYYRHNKKEGFWKYYNQDGLLTDSVGYKHDMPVIREL